MNEDLGLGEADADSRWIGVRRHQAILIILGLGLSSDWTMSPHAPAIEIAAGLAFAVGALPWYDGQTAGEGLTVACRYLVRPHWREHIAREFGDDVVLWAVGEVALRGYELTHRGRLDLAGRDATIVEGLVDLADAASASRTSRHFSQHVVTTKNGHSTLLTLPPDVPAPDEWRLNNALALEVLGLGHDGGADQILERFTYVRTKDQLARVYRIRDFSAVPAARGLLEQLLRSTTALDVALHVDVVPGIKAQRLAARAVHRVGSDDTTSRAAGFRRTARSSRNFERLSQREARVAGGRSLLRLAVFVIVHGDSLEEMHARSALVWRYAHDAGLRLERGWGLQARWHDAQLPGGSGW